MWLPLAARGLIAARGPITALTILVSTATFSAGAFFVALHNTAIDCAHGSATGAACGVDILTDLVTFIAAAGATAGATFIGLTSPTPRDGFGPIFRVDGVDVDWYTHANWQRHGLNRTSDNPAVIEWQFNHTSPIQTYITYADNGYLIKRLDTGIDIPDPSGKRSDCRAYYSTIFWTDDLRSWEYASTPSYLDWADTANDIFYKFANSNWQAGCVWFEGSKAANGDIYEASFELSASCSESVVQYLNCGTATYTEALVSFNF